MKKPKRVDTKIPTPPKHGRPVVPGYDQHRGEIAVRMGHFFIRYLQSIYHHFSGDLALVIVLGEIAHHNVSRYYCSSGPLPAVEETNYDNAAVFENLEPCNAFSLAAATGIPRETVRRKMDQLVKRGWVQRAPNGEVRIQPAVGQHFYPEFNLNLLHELFTLNDQLKAVLATPARQPKRSQCAPKSSGRTPAAASTAAG